MQNKTVSQPEVLNCDDLNYQIGIVTDHAIYPNDFAARVRNFPTYNPPASTLPLPGKIFTKAEIITELDKGDCENYAVEIKGANMPSNQDITFNLFSKPLSVCYPVELFRGIIRLYNPDTFIFYKARESQNDFDIIFEVKRDNQTVYYGDLSNDIE